ncbi:MAG: type II restriction endonuclease [Alphaproteobacteria bacterium]
MKYLAELAPLEREQFYAFLNRQRKEQISTPKETVSKVLKLNKELFNVIKNKANISYSIEELRNATWEYFLKEEAKFNASILKQLSSQFEIPKQALSEVISKLDLTASRENVVGQIENIFGEYAGRISPYIYNLSLSNTQSRRSRAGKVFEGIIYSLYERFDYPYASQATLGSKNFTQKGLGKIVDSLLPNLEAFQQRRDKVIIGTMKTTLRERWQEVIEEINRTSLPQIYLLTVDDNISEQKINQMANHNVILVVYERVKKLNPLLSKRNVISFEDYFLSEIPEKLNYWNS